MRAYIAKALALIFIFIMTAQPAAALMSIGIPFVSTGCAGFMAPLANTACSIEEFNSVHTACISAEHLSIDFPLCSSDQAISASGNGDSSDGTLAVGEKTSGALPFGLVDLALPAISQTAIDSITSERTYFFTDTF